MAIFTALGLFIGLLITCPAAQAEEETPTAAEWGPPLRSAIAGKRVVFFGDSITDQGGYIKVLADAVNQDQPAPVCQVANARDLLSADYKLPESVAVLFNAGLNGGKVTDLRDGAENLYGDAQGSFVAVLDKAKPQVVVIYIGINDVWHGEKGTTAEVFARELAALVAECGRRKLAVVIATPSVIGEELSGTNPFDAELDRYAEISRKVAEQNKATLCDLRASMADELKEKNSENADKGILTYDGVHLSDAGNQLVASLLARAIVSGHEN